MIAGLAFALSPHLLTVLGPVSAEALPACLAPWVMVPLVTAVREGSPRRAAMRSGIAVLLMGGYQCGARAGRAPTGGVVAADPATRSADAAPDRWPGSSPSFSPPRGGSPRCSCSATTARRSSDASSRPPRRPARPRSSSRCAARRTGLPTCPRRGGMPGRCCSVSPRWSSTPWWSWLSGSAGSLSVASRIGTG